MNFHRIAAGLPVQELCDQIAALPWLWNESQVRQDFPGSAHHSTQCIFARGPRAFTFAEYMDNTDAFNYPALDLLASGLEPLLAPLLTDIGATQLGYVLIVRLKPGGHIEEHIDEGVYADHYSRFHVALETAPGATLTVGGEVQHMARGEAWWFNHKRPHAGDNLDSTWRTHLIFDAVTPLIRVGT